MAIVSRNSINETSTKKQIKGNIYLAKGDAGGALAPGRLCRVWRQPPRLPGLQRDPPGLLPHPDRGIARPRSRADRDAEAAADRHEEEHGVSEQAAVEPVEAAEAARRCRRGACRERSRPIAIRTIMSLRPTAPPSPRRCRSGASRGFSRTSFSARSWGRSQFGPRRAPRAEEAGGTGRARRRITIRARATSAMTRRRRASTTTMRLLPSMPASRCRPDNLTPAEAGTAEPLARVETVGGDELEERRPPRALLPQLQDSRSHQAPADHASAGDQGRARQQGRRADELHLARRPLLRADAEHPARRPASRADHQLPTDRRRLKDLMSDLEVPEGHGRHRPQPPAASAPKPEIKRDFEYLRRLWTTSAISLSNRRRPPSSTRRAA